MTLREFIRENRDDIDASAERPIHDQSCTFAQHGDPSPCTCPRYCPRCGTDEWSDDPHEDECPRRTTEPEPVTRPTAQHTPGPWRVGTHRLDDVGIEILAIYAGAEMIARLPARGPRTGDDASLIAAAPAMLEALRFAYLRLSVPDRDVIGPTIRAATEGA